MPRVEQQFVDVVFLVGGYEYFCHKPIFSTRSEYFRALLADHFDECQMDGQYDLPIIQIHQVSPKGSRKFGICVYCIICHFLSFFSIQLRGHLRVHEHVRGDGGGGGGAAAHGRHVPAAGPHQAGRQAARQAGQPGHRHRHPPHRQALQPRQARGPGGLLSLPTPPCHR